LRLAVEDWSIVDVLAARLTGTRTVLLLNCALWKNLSDGNLLKRNSERGKIEHGSAALATKSSDER
jgi:hypothetical protein